MCGEFAPIDSLRVELEGAEDYSMLVQLSSEWFQCILIMRITVQVCSEATSTPIHSFSMPLESSSIENFQVCLKWFMSRMLDFVLESRDYPQTKALDMENAILAIWTLNFQSLFSYDFWKSWTSLSFMEPVEKNEKRRVPHHSTALCFSMPVCLLKEVSYFQNDFSLSESKEEAMVGPSFRVSVSAFLRSLNDPPSKWPQS